MSQKCPKCPDIIWDMCYSMLIISGPIVNFTAHTPICPDVHKLVYKGEPGERRGSGYQDPL